MIAVPAGAEEKSADAEAPPTHRFLTLTQAERFWYYEGAFRVLSTWVASNDPEKGTCVARWYLHDRRRKQALIESVLADDPGSNEVTVMLSLVIRDCGDITVR